MPGPPDPLAHLIPKTDDPCGSRFRMEGNRDLVITVECRADEVVMTANAQHWQVADLERDPAARCCRGRAGWIAGVRRRFARGRRPIDRRFVFG